MKRKHNNSSTLRFKQKTLLISILLASGLLILGLFATVNTNVPRQTPPSPPILGSPVLEPLTIHCNEGRLGNQMCTLATLFGLSNLNGRKMLIPRCNYEKLSAYFDIEIPVLNDKNFRERFSWIIKPFFEEKDKMIDTLSNIIKGYLYPCSYTFFDHVRRELRLLFRFKENIRNYARDTLSKARGDRTDKDLIFVGVHVRRTDYLGKGWLHKFGGKSVDLEYFEEATNYYREKYGSDKVIFVAVSDDREWCRQNLVQFGVIVTAEAPGPAHDMAALVECNHTIMTYGTFGFWGGYLAGGEVTYFDKFLTPDTEFTKKEFLFDKLYLPGWHGIKTKSKQLE